MRSLHEWEGGLNLVSLSSLIFPSGSDCLHLGEELLSGLSVEVQVSAERSLSSGEGEHGEGDGDGKVNSDLGGFNLVLEFTGSTSRSGEDGSSVSVLVTELKRERGKIRASPVSGGTEV